MKRVNILISVFSLVCICALIVVFTINQNVTFELKGEENITIEVNTNYIDEGATARVFKNDLSNYVQIKNKVDYHKVGTYSINYYLTYAGKVYMLTRNVTVVDKAK